MRLLNNLKLLAAILIFMMVLSTLAWSAETGEPMMHMDHSMHMDQAEHMKHMKMLQTKGGFTVKNVNYVIPDETLLNESGKNISLKKILNSGKPVALNFIFTTCTTICPVMTATFSQMRHQLGKASSKIQLVSITIDPEYDRPEVLKEYSARFGAGEGWSFLTGDGNTINKILRSFNVDSGSKMNHQPITLFKNPKSSTWIRVNGLASGKQMAELATERLLN